MRRPTLYVSSAAALLSLATACSSSDSGTNTTGAAGAGQGGSSAGASANGGTSAAGTTSAGGSAAAGASAGTGGSSEGVGGTAAGGTAAGGTGAAGAQGGSAGAVMPMFLPTATGACPPMANLNGGVVTLAGQQVTVWSGDPAKGPGPLVVYWYATGSNAQEPTFTLGQAQIAKITGMGGMVVAPNKTNAMGKTTGNQVWYTGDVAVADEAVACAISGQNIDPRRIHTAGYSAGALQATYMWYARSGYLASVLLYSGGDDGVDSAPLQDAAHPPAALVTHGAQGKDTYGGFDFFNASTTLEKTMKKDNAFVIDCNDGGAHSDVASRTKVAPQAIQFFLDHPYGVSPEPYATLPTGWPSYCTIQ